VLIIVLEFLTDLYIFDEPPCLQWKLTPLLNPFYISK